LQYFLNCTGTVLPTTGVAVNVEVAVKEGVDVKVNVGDGRTVDVAEGLAVIADRVVGVAVTAGRGRFNIDAAIGGDTGVAWEGLVLFWIVRDAGRLMGFHRVPPVLTYR
jgi:hypothetical protein